MKRFILVMLIFLFSCKKEQQNVDDLYGSYVGEYMWIYSIHQIDQISYYHFPPDSSYYSFELKKDKTLSINSNGNIILENASIKYLSISEDRIYFRFNSNDTLFNCGFNVESGYNLRKSGTHDIFDDGTGYTFSSFFMLKE